MTCLLLLIAATAIAQTTGRIVGRVLDSTGAALPGVSVTVTSPSLQGANTTTTDGEGNYRLPLLPPGTYTVKAMLQGFRTVQQANVEVSLDRTVEVNLTLGVASMTETVEVSAASPVVDTTSTTIGITAKAELLNRLPIQRDIYNVTRFAPGTTQDAVGPAVFGSTGAENQYIIEGLNVTGLAAGQERKNLNFDFVDSIEVKTGGLDAEYGRVTGGIVNVVTKSGGNAFHGSLFGFNSGGGLQSNDDTANDRPQTTTTVSKIDRQWDFGGTLGGYIAKDKLWFFGSYAHMFRRDQTTVIRVLSAPGSPAVGSNIPADNNTDTFAAKVTYKLGTSHTLVGSVNGDPGTRDGNVFVVAGPESTWKGTQDTGGPDATVNYTGLFGSNFVVNGIYGRHYEKSVFAGPGSTTAQLLDQTVSPNIRTGGFGGYENDEYTRNYYGVKATKYFGGHEIKAGIDWEDNKSVVDRFSGGGGDLIYKLGSPGAYYYRHRYFVNDLAPGFSRNDPATWTPAVPLTSKPDTLNNAFFARDSWKITSNFTVDGGVRWERQEVKDRNSSTVIDLTTNWAPRVGFVWDFAKNGRSKIYGSYGRYYESIPLDIDIRSFGGELACFCYNFDPNPANRTPDPAAPRRSSVLGSSVEPVDPNLRGQYLNEVVFGGEYEVAPNVSVSAKYVRRDLARVIEDFLIPTQGNYFVANPGQGLGSTMAFYCVNSDCGPGNDGTVAAPPAKRINNSVEFSARKNFSDNWQLIASYVWSKLEGNYDGTFQNSTGQLDPNINSAFDYADFLVNAQGRLSNERTHQIKVDGSYEFSKGPLHGLNVALSTHWFSGLPENAYGYSFAYANWEYYLAPRGSLGTGPSDWEADIQGRYLIKMGSTQRLNLIVNVFNLFNRQAITQLDQRYNLVQDGPCAGVPGATCNGDGGLVTVPNTLTPVSQLANPLATATNPDFLKKGINFTAPRSVQIGVRFEF